MEMSKDHQMKTGTTYSACARAGRFQVCSGGRLLARGAGVGLTGREHPMELVWGKYLAFSGWS